MKMLLGILSHFQKKHLTKNNKSFFILYKIVGSKNSLTYTLQYINTNAFICLTLEEIVFDLDVLAGLHPVQSCYIGLEYAKQFKNLNLLNKSQQQKLKYSHSRYGKYFLQYQDRKGSLGFIDKETERKFLMDPRDIALSEELINEFDAVQTFFIGLSAGLKLDNSIPDCKHYEQQPKRPYLYIVK